MEKSFFKIQSSLRDGETIQANLEIDPDHQIFQGHFPGQPLLPGVCMVEIVKKVLVGSLGFSLGLKFVDFIKFIKLIDPVKSNEIQISINFQSTENNQLLVSATILQNKTSCFKFQGKFIIE